MCAIYLVETKQKKNREMRQKQYISCDDDDKKIFIFHNQGVSSGR